MSGSEEAVMSGRDSYSVTLQKNQPPPSMRLAFSPDGTAVYKPIAAIPPSYNVSGGSQANGANLGDAAVAAVQHNENSNSCEVMRKKRGRPRKYGPDGTMSLALTTVSPGVSPLSGGIRSDGFPAAASSSPRKKARGRPPGSSKKNQKLVLGSAGIGFTPHVITVKTGEDVSSKIMALSNGLRVICVLSANGAISDVTLRQAATSVGTVTYEGRFEILSLSGSYLLSDSSGQCSPTSGLSVLLAGSDGRVIGGGVAGLLRAASPVQIVVGSFIADGKKKSKHKSNSNPSAPAMVMSPPVGTGTSSPPSRGTSSESSDGNRGPHNLSTGACNINTQQELINMPRK